jgi:hypothetical protein
MAINSLSYAPPIRRGTRPVKPDYELLENAIGLAEEGKSLESVTKTFEHLFPSQKIPDLASSPFSFTQGSSRVTIKLENDELVVSVPLVKLPTGGGSIAALRFVLTKISGSGQLHQPRLRGDDVFLEFRDKLPRLHPTKLVEVLRRMPFEADNNDDWLIGQFSASPVERMPVDPVNDEEFARCDAIWREHWNDVDELLKESIKKRSVWFLDEVTAYAIFRIRFALPIVGFLASRLSEAASTWNDGDEDPVKRETALGKTIKEMKDISPDELRKNLGHVVYAFSPLEDGSPSMLSGYFGDDGNYIDTIDELRKSGKAFDAALGLICTYNYLLARHNWREEVETEMKKGLEMASGKPWREVATVLFDHAKALASKYGGDDDDEDEED